MIVNVRAQELEAERAAERQAFEEQSLVMGLPIRCRQMIDTGTVLHGAELENFWSDTQRIATRISTWVPGDSRENVPQQASTAGVQRTKMNIITPRVAAFSRVGSVHWSACMTGSEAGPLMLVSSQPLPSRAVGLRWRWKRAAATM